MFVLNEDKSIYVTRGDIVFFTVSAADIETEEKYKFQPGDIVRIKVFGKKNAASVVLQKDFAVTEETENVDIYLDKEDTKIGGVISKPVDYWYEIELNPYSDPQTIIGYNEDGPMVFKLFPEVADIPAFEPVPEDYPFIDDELDLTSDRPVQNQAIARAVVTLGAVATKAANAVTSSEIALSVERKRIDNLLSGATADGAEVVDVRVGADGVTYDSAGSAVRGQYNKVNKKVNLYRDNVMLHRNLIDMIVQDYICSNTAGTKIVITANNGYGYAKFAVEAGEIISISSTNFNNNFSVVTDADDVILGKLNEFLYEENAAVYQMPALACHVYLCADLFSTAWMPRSVVVLHTEEDITDTTIYNTTNFPYGEVARVQADKLYDAASGVFVKDVVNEVVNGTKAYTFSNQYLNKDELINGYYYSAAGINVASADYSIFPAIRLKAGKYHLKYVSANFSHIVGADGTSTTLANLMENGIATLKEDSVCYFTKTANAPYAMLADNDLPDEYVYGTYHYSPEKIFKVGSKRRYTTLREGIEAAEKFLDAKVYVDPEEFDLVKEFGQEYLDAYDGSEGMIGIWLKNRVHVIFASGAKVLFNYTGANENVHTYFSPFNAGEYGFTLENAWVESKNCRYTMHDERNSAEIPYTNHYKRCTFIHDSSECSWGAHQALGGGLGCWGDILIEDCYMSANGYNDVLTYHNAGYNQPDLTEFKSNITIRGCYVDGAVRVNATGYSKLVTVAHVSGNCLATEPHSGKTTEDATDNVLLRAWNNTIV